MDANRRAADRAGHEACCERPNRPFGHAMTKGAELVTVPLHQRRSVDMAADAGGTPAAVKPDDQMGQAT